MRRSLFPVVLLVVALTTAACAASEPPGWSFAPPTAAPAVTPAPSGAPTGGPSEPTPVPGGETPPVGDAVLISAVGIAFEQREVTVAAGAPFVIRFDNRDAGIPHNVEIKDSMGMSVFKGEVFNGSATKDYQVAALAAGTYQFVCTVHPNMVGTLTVGG